MFSIVISGASGTLCCAVDEASAGCLAGNGKEREKPFFHPMAAIDYNRKSLLPSGGTLGTFLPKSSFKGWRSCFISQSFLCFNFCSAFIYSEWGALAMPAVPWGSHCLLALPGAELRQELPRWMLKLLFAHSRVPRLAEFWCFKVTSERLKITMCLLIFCSEQFRRAQWCWGSTKAILHRTCSTPEPG